MDCHISKENYFSKQFFVVKALTNLIRGVNMQDKVLKCLEKWLKDENNSKLVLASKLGYRSSTVVDHWLKRKRLPSYTIKPLAEIIGVKI